MKTGKAVRSKKEVAVAIYKVLAGELLSTLLCEDAVGRVSGYVEELYALTFKYNEMSGSSIVEALALIGTTHEKLAALVVKDYLTSARGFLERAKFAAAASAWEDVTFCVDNVRDYVFAANRRRPAGMPEVTLANIGTSEEALATLFSGCDKP